MSHERMKAVHDAPSAESSGADDARTLTRRGGWRPTDRPARPGHEQRGEAVDGVETTLRWRPRVLAIASLACAALLVLAVVVFLTRNFGDLVIALLGVALAVAGGWWIITERMPRRAIGVAVAVVGAGVVVGAVVGAARDAERPVVPILVLAVLLVATVALARAALAHHLHGSGRDRARPVARPQHPVLLCNPWSGGGKVAKFGLVDLADELGVEVVMLDRGLDLEQLARDAVARGADCLGMAGGDGSQALVASIAIEHDLPFVIVSAGTRNHFALDLGIDREDPRRSLYAFRDAVERRIDYATVGDRLFVNNVSLGIYATIVQQEGYRDAKAETTKALLPEMLGRHRGALRPPVHRAGWHGDRRRVPHPGVEQPLRAGGDPRCVAAPPARHRDARRRGGHRHHRARRRVGHDHVGPRPAPPQPRLARIHHRPFRGPVSIRQGLRRHRR